jgi:hypothetical protein
MVDHGLHVLAHVLDDFGPGTGDLVLVEGGPAGDVIAATVASRRLGHSPSGTGGRWSPGGRSQTSVSIERTDGTSRRSR